MLSGSVRTRLTILNRLESGLDSHRSLAISVAKQLKPNGRFFLTDGVVLPSQFAPHAAINHPPADEPMSDLPNRRDLFGGGAREMKKLLSIRERARSRVRNGGHGGDERNKRALGERASDQGAGGVALPAGVTTRSPITAATS